MCLASFLEIKAQVKKKKKLLFLILLARLVSREQLLLQTNKKKIQVDVTGDAKKHTSSPYILADALIVSDTTNRDRDKQENKDKLNEEDKKSLMLFLAQLKHINLA